MKLSPFRFECFRFSGLAVHAMPVPQKFMWKYVAQDGNAWQKCSDLRDAKLRAMLLEKKKTVSFSISGFTTFKYTLQAYDRVEHKMVLIHPKSPAIMCAPLIKYTFEVLFNPELMVVAVVNDNWSFDFPMMEVENLTWAKLKNVVCGLAHVVEIEFVSDGELQ